MSAANIVPHLLAPQELQTEESEVEVENNTKLLMKSASITENSRGAAIKGDVYAVAPSKHPINMAPSQVKNPN